MQTCMLPGKTSHILAKLHIGCQHLGQHKQNIVDVSLIIRTEEN